MNIDVFIKIYKNKNAVLTFSTNNEIIKNNEELNNEFRTNFFYVEESLKINKENIFNNFPKLTSFFKNNNLEFNFSFLMNDDEVEKEGLINFLKVNKDLPITLEIGSYKYLIDNFKENDLPNLKIKFKNNLHNIEFKEFYNMYMFLKQIVDFIKYYNLSPLEQVILVYDILKSKKYIEENEDESPSVSRSLNEIIKSGKIVCLGYANLFNYILDELGIENEKIYLTYTNRSYGHARSLIHLKDNKYNIDDFFVSDITFDSKKSKNCKNYLNNYSYFLKPLNFFNHPNEKIQKPILLELLKMNNNNIYSYLNNATINNKYIIFIQLNKYLTQISLPTLNWNAVMYNNMILMQNIKNIKKHFNTTIPYKAFKNALYKVRKIEFINDIIKTEVDEKEIDDICDIFYWHIPEIKEAKIKNTIKFPNLDISLKEAKASSVDEDLLRMRLIKTFKNSLNDFPENDFITKM